MRVSIERRRLLKAAGAMLLAACSPVSQPTPTNSPELKRFPTPTDQEILESFKGDFEKMKTDLLEVLDPVGSRDIIERVNNVDISTLPALRSVFDSQTYARPIPPPTYYILNFADSNPLYMYVEEPSGENEFTAYFYFDSNGQLGSQTHDYVDVDKLESAVRQKLKDVPDTWELVNIQGKEPITGKDTQLSGKTTVAYQNGKRKTFAILPSGEVRVNVRPAA